MASAYLVPVAQLLRDVPSTLRVEFSALFDEMNEFDPLPAGGADVPRGAIAEVNLHLESFSGGLRARGQIAAPWRALCRRCSIDIDGHSEVQVSERFVDDRGPGDDDAYLVVNDFVDLAPLVHEAILLDLPVAPLCRPDCRGLCVQCGSDKNLGDCGCLAPIDPRWATLDNLRFVDNESNEASSE